MKTFLVSVLVCLFVCSGLAQDSRVASKINSTNQLSVELDLEWNTNNAVFHAPATIDIFAYVELSQSELRAGDVVKVEFFSGMSHVGSGKAVWHDEYPPPLGKWHGFGPPPAVFDHIEPAGFYPAKYVWKKVPAGVYAITAEVKWEKLSAISAPVTVTVLSQ